MAGDLLPPPLYVPYVDLLAALASSPATAPHCYSLLSAAGGGSPLGVTQLFSSLHQYYNRLMHEVGQDGNRRAYSKPSVCIGRGEPLVTGTDGRFDKVTIAVGETKCTYENKNITASSWKATDSSGTYSFPKHQ